MKRILPLCMVCVALVSFLHPVDVWAAKSDDFLKRLDQFMDSLTTDTAAVRLDQMDHAFTTQSELFPRHYRQATGTGALDAGPFGSMPAGVMTFTDVADDAWFAPYVRDMSAQQIISGYRTAEGAPTGLFGPGDSITVEQLAKLAVLSAGIDVVTCPDTARNPQAAQSWSTQVVSCAEMRQWTLFTDGTVDLVRPATRREVVQTVLEAFRTTLRPATGKVFTDVPATMEMRDAIETAAADGIVGGYTDEAGEPTGTFGPLDAVNRAEAAKILSLAIQIYSK